MCVMMVRKDRLVEGEDRDRPYYHLIVVYIPNNLSCKRSIVEVMADTHNYAE